MVHRQVSAGFVGHRCCEAPPAPGAESGVSRFGLTSLLLVQRLPRSPFGASDSGAELVQLEVLAPQLGGGGVSRQSVRASAVVGAEVVIRAGVAEFSGPEDVGRPSAKLNE